MIKRIKEAINSEEQEPYDILNLKTTLENRLSEIRPLICKWFTYRIYEVKTVFWHCFLYAQKWAIFAPYNNISYYLSSIDRSETSWKYPFIQENQ